MTAHELARKLLAGPDIEVRVPDTANAMTDPVRDVQAVTETVRVLYPHDGNPSRTDHFLLLAGN